MATVTNAITLPGGGTPTHCAVEIELIASATGAPAAGWVTATDVTILARYRPTVADGEWTADLTPNDDIDPSGTVYKVTEYADKTRVVNYIEVGAGGGTVHDLLTSGPSGLVFDSVTNHAADTSTHGVTGAIVGTTDTQTLTNKTLTSPTITGGLAVAQGGTGGTTAAAARTNLAAQRTFAVHVSDYGSPSGTDDTSVLQAALAAVPDAGGTLIIPPGTWKVDTNTSTGMLAPKSNTTVVLQPGCTIEALASSSTTYRVFLLSSKNNVTISGYGAFIVGDRDIHNGSTGEQGHGIRVEGTSTNVTIEGVSISNCWGDGIAIGGSAGVVTVRDVTCTNNRRLGISCGNATWIEVQNSTFSGSNGTLPGGGLDFEPNSGSESISGLVSGCYAYDNDGIGFQIGGAGKVNVRLAECVAVDNGQVYTFGQGTGFLLSTPTADSTITLDGCRSVGSANGYGISVSSASNSSGVVSIRGCRASGNNKSGILVAGANTTVDGCDVESNGTHGVEVTKASTRIMGVHAGSNSTSGTNAGKDMNIAAATCVLVGNVMTGTSAQYHLNLKSSATGTTVVGNAAAGSPTTGPYLDEGSSNLVAGNIGFGPSDLVASTLPTAAARYRGQTRVKTGSSAEDRLCVCVLSSDGSTYKWIDVKDGSTVT